MLHWTPRVPVTSGAPRRTRTSVASVDTSRPSAVSSTRGRVRAGGSDDGIGDPAQQAAQLPHGGRCLHVMADHVADDQDRGAVGPHERVVPVASDLGPAGGREIADREFEPLERWWCRHQRPLERHRGGMLLRRSPQVEFPHADAPLGVVGEDDDGSDDATVPDEGHPGPGDRQGAAVAAPERVLAGEGGRCVSDLEQRAVGGRQPFTVERLVVDEVVDLGADQLIDAVAEEFAAPRIGGEDDAAPSGAPVGGIDADAE